MSGGAVIHLAILGEPQALCGAADGERTVGEPRVTCEACLRENEHGEFPQGYHDAGDYG